MDHYVNKTLTFDILRQKRQPGERTLPTDAVSCFNEVVHSVASLAMQCQGLPQGPIICMLTTLRHMKHRIRTIFGDSEGYFDALDSLYGVPMGEASRSKELVRAMVQQLSVVGDSPLLEGLRSEEIECVFKLGLSGEEISFVGYSPLLMMLTQ